MNVLADSYIPDEIAAYAIRMRAAWRLSAIERETADAFEASTPTPRTS